ncbi:kinase-like protein [Gigaspora margarita]|uniref:Kinase-like protein n=1 Tax=Gigaspora margarita TaxID=4874 RepID=A0A8H4ETV1_GIGMA|nr:kinase-like protein [Gigaspora margarita]
MMIADFGISNQIYDATLNSNSAIFGTPTYIEPQCLKICQMLIFEGKRETPVNSTPKQYVELYTFYWDDNSKEHPDIKKVLEVLKNSFVNDSRYLLPQYLSFYLRQLMKFI